MIDPQPGDEGRAVLYWRPGMKQYERERGVISSWNDDYVFVRYTMGITAAATRRADLTWEHDAPVGTNWLDRSAEAYVIK
jgi:hypothetical protein